MLIEEALFNLLSNDSRITAITAQRIYPVTLPEFQKSPAAPSYPALVFALQARERLGSHDEPVDLVESRFEMSCLGQQYFAVKQLADAVRLALNGQAGALQALYGMEVAGISLEGERDDYVFDEVESLSLYYVPMDFLIQHKEDLDG